MYSDDHILHISIYLFLWIRFLLIHHGVIYGHHGVIYGHHGVIYGHHSFQKVCVKYYVYHNLYLYILEDIVVLGEVVLLL